MKLFFWRKDAKKHHIEDDIPRYPPFVRGLPLARVDRLLDDQHELLYQLRQAVRASDVEYEQLYLGALRRYAQFVHLLPASENHHHRGAGGLFRHGLEVALWATQAADRMLFAIDEAPRERKTIIPRWEFAVFISALCHDIGKPINDISVLDESGVHTWNPFGEDLLSWGKKLKLQRYFVRWKQGRQHKNHESLSTMVLARVMDENAKQYLCATKIGAEPMEKIGEAVLGSVSGRNVIYDLVLSADRKSVEKDLRERGMEDGLGSQYGVPVERYLLDAMRRLIKQGKWKVNKNGSKVWVLDKQLYVVWPQGATDVTQILAQDNIPGIPRDADTLADILMARDLIVGEQGESERPKRYWTISPEMIGGTSLSAIRMSSPELLIDPAPASVPGTAIAGMATGRGKEQNENAKGEEAPRENREQEQKKGEADVVSSEKNDDEKCEGAEGEALSPPKAKDQEPAGPAHPTREENTEPSALKEVSVPEDVPPPPEEEEPWQHPVPAASTSRAPVKEKPAASGGKNTSDSQKTGGLSEQEVAPESPTEEPPEYIEVIDDSGASVKKSIAGKKNPTVMHDPDPVPEPTRSYEEVGEPVAETAQAAEFQKKTEATKFCAALLALAHDLKIQNDRWWGEHAIMADDEHLAIWYPKGLQGYCIDPKELLAELADLDWVESDRMSAMKMVHEIDGFVNDAGKPMKRKAILLTPQMTEEFLHFSGPAKPWRSRRSPAPQKPTKESAEKHAPPSANEKDQSPEPMTPQEAEMAKVLRKEMLRHNGPLKTEEGTRGPLVKYSAIKTFLVERFGLTETGSLRATIKISNAPGFYFEKASGFDCLGLQLDQGERK